MNSNKPSGTVGGNSKLHLHRSSVIVRLLLTVVTFGVYMPIWFLRRRVGLNDLDSPRKLQRWPFVLTIAFVTVQFAVAFVFAARPGVAPGTQRRPLARCGSRQIEKT